MISILIVEDESIIALDIKLTLKRLGYEILATVPSGELAIEKLKEKKPDLILMDINLKGELNGIETAELIHNEYFIPTIFLSALNGCNNLADKKPAAGAGQLIKPFHERDLQAAIVKALL